MDERISRVVAVAAAVTMPLLGGCGGSSAGSSAGSSGSAAPASSQAAAPTTGPAAVASPTVDPAAQTKQVQAATEKFVKTVLTIGYPDKTFGDYTDRIEPLMTTGGFRSLESADSTRKGSSALKTLYAQRARSAPTFSDAAEVTSIESASATAELAYENVAQQKSGSGWKTLKSLGKGRVTVKLVRADGKWLVENAS